MHFPLGARGNNFDSQIKIIYSWSKRTPFASSGPFCACKGVPIYTDVGGLNVSMPAGKTDVRGDDFTDGRVPLGNVAGPVGALDLVVHGDEHDIIFADNFPMLKLNALTTTADTARAMATKTRCCWKDTIFGVHCLRGKLFLSECCWAAKKLLV